MSGEVGGKYFSTCQLDVRITRFFDIDPRDVSVILQLQSANKNRCRVRACA